VKTYVRWRYLAEFFLEREMFQTKVVENIKTHVLCWITPPPRKSCRLWDNMEKYGRARQATDGSIARRMRFVRRKIKATATLRVCKICCFSKATVVTRTLLNALCLNKIVLILTGVSWVQIDIFMDPTWFVMSVFCWASLTQELRGSACLLGTRSSCWWRVLVTLLITTQLHCVECESPDRLQGHITLWRVIFVITHIPAHCCQHAGLSQFV
jgi:hypothetical protein